MKTKDLIKRLHECDPSGELDVCVDNEDINSVHAMEAYYDGKLQVLLLQLQSGGVGLNLQHFSKVIFMSPWWTAALMDQAIGRAVRIGQKDKVEVSLLILKEEESMNIDETMLSKVEEKRSILHGIFLHANKGEIEEDPQ